MKPMARFLRFLALLAVLAALPGARMHAQSSPAGKAASHSDAVPNEEHMDAPDTNAQTEEYRHSATVQAVARFMHVKTETAAQIFEDFNSAVLIVVIGVFLWKVVPAMFRRRSATLQKDLTLARTATEDANRRLAEIEARLARLDTEIDAIRQQAEKDSAEDEKRMRETLESERQRIIASAEQEITAVQGAAQRELKKFAADLTIDNARRRMQLSSDTDRALVKEFGKGLSGGSGGKA